MGEISFKIIIVVFNLIFIAFVSGIIIFIREYRLKKRNYTNRLEEINKEHKKELLNGKKSENWTRFKDAWSKKCENAESSKLVSHVFSLFLHLVSNLH